MAPQPTAPPAAGPPSAASTADRAWLRSIYNLDSPGKSWHYHEKWFKAKMLAVVHQWQQRSRYLEQPAAGSSCQEVMPPETWDAEVDRLVEWWVQEPVAATLHHAKARVRELGRYEHKLRAAYAEKTGKQVRYFLKVHLRVTDVA
ncbi:MAG: hypothetical protein Q9207_002163, partial [Kuettlingeria erythrocarpa]